MLAWWQTHTSAQERSLVLLLTHIEARLGDVALDRKELTRVDLVLQPGHVHTLHFTAGQAPEATPQVTLKIPAETTSLELRCRFTLPNGVLVRTRGRATLPPMSDDVQVFDVGACGELRP